VIKKEQSSESKEAKEEEDAKKEEKASWTDYQIFCP
jgi:hypothetical protein